MSVLVTVNAVRFNFRALVFLSILTFAYSLYSPYTPTKRTTVCRPFRQGEKCFPAVMVVMRRKAKMKMGGGDTLLSQCITHLPFCQYQIEKNMRTIFLFGRYFPHFSQKNALGFLRERVLCFNYITSDVSIAFARYRISSMQAVTRITVADIRKVRCAFALSRRRLPYLLYDKRLPVR